MEEVIKTIASWSIVLLALSLLMTNCTTNTSKAAETGVEKLKTLNIQCTPNQFCYYIKKDEPKIVKHFLDAGFDVDMKNEVGHTGLFDAAVFDSRKVAQLLIERGANVDERDVGGSTPLMYAAYHGSFRTAELLIHNKADVNLQNNKGWTALMFAIEGKNKNTIDVLITIDTNLMLRNKDNNIARDFAIKYGFERLPQYMQDKIEYLKHIDNRYNIKQNYKPKNF